MELDTFYENTECRDINNTAGPQTHGQDEGKDETKELKKEKSKQGGSRCLVLMTVCLGLICVLLLVFITLYITTTAERDLFKSYKNTVEEFNHTINSLQDKNTGIITDKDQLKNNFNSLSQKKLELETRVNDLSAEKSQLQGSFNSLSQKKLELETRVNDLSVEKSQLQGSFNSLSWKKLELETRITSLSEELKKEKSKQGNLCAGFCFMSSESKSWSESRKFCRDRGADLVIINTEEKQRFVSSLVNERVWIGLSDSETEGIMKWVDNSALKQGFWYRGEPNNYQGTDEDCIELDPRRDHVNNWNDEQCSEKMKWICEK